jgi:hypothetical protein
MQSALYGWFAGLDQPPVRRRKAAPIAAPLLKHPATRIAARIRRPRSEYCKRRFTAAVII